MTQTRRAKQWHVNLSVTVAENERQHLTTEGSGLNRFRGIKEAMMMVCKMLVVENALIKSQKRQVKHLWFCLFNQPLKPTENGGSAKRFATVEE